MTEEVWPGCTDTRQMLAFLDPPPNDRKAMLFAVACCRAVWPHLPRPTGLPDLKYAESWSLEGIDWAEKHADRMASPEIDPRHLSYTTEAAVLHWQELPYSTEQRRDRALRGQIEDTDDWSRHDMRRARGNVNIHQPWFTEHELNDYCKSWCRVAELADSLPDFVHSPPGEALANMDDELLLPDLLRDIFGNPFRPVAFDPSWRTSAAVGLATSMYDSRDFGAMPILADALEDAGCDRAEVLEHCRGDGPHVRGCWVVDLVLGKS